MIFNEGRVSSMLRKAVFIFLVIATLALSGIAQDQAEKVSIGKKEVVHSSVLNEDRNVYVFLPEGYSRSADRYPVLYTLYSVAADYHFYTGVVLSLIHI